MATYNAVKISFDDEKDKKSSSKRHASLDNVNFVKNDTTDESCLMTLPISNSLESDNTDVQCKEAKFPKPKKNNRKRRLKDNDAPIDIHVDTSTLKDDSIGTNSCHDSLAKSTSKTDLETAALPLLSRSKKRRMRKKQELNSSGITNKVHVSLADLDSTGTEENALISEKQSDSPGSPCARIVNKHSGDAALSLVEKENIKKKKNRRKREKQKLDTSVISDNAHQPHSDLHAVGMGNGLLSDKQSDPRSPSVSMVEKHDNNGEGAFISDGNENIKKKKNRRKKEKQKLDTSVISDNAHHPHADLDAVGMEGNSLLSDKHSDPRSPSVNMVAKHDNNGVDAFILDGNENIKKKKNRRRKREKQKLDTSVISDNAYHPHADLDVVGMQGNDLLSDKQSDPRSPSVNMVEKHDNSGEGAFISENENIKEKRNRSKRKKQKLGTSVISDNAHHPHVDTDVVGMEGNDLLSAKQSDPISPSVNMLGKHDRNGDSAFISDGNENIKERRNRSEKKKQKLKTSVITDKAHVPSAELDFIEVDKHASISEKQSDSSRSPRSMVNNHNHCDPAAAFVLVERENVQIKREKKKQKLNTSVIIDKVHVPPAELDSPDEKNAVIYVKEGDSQRTPSSNQGAARMLVEKENTTTDHIEGNLRSYCRKGRKFSDSEENIAPSTVAGQASSDSDEIHSTKISNNEVKGVQADKVATSVNVVGNVLVEKTSDCSNVDFLSPESKDIIKLKKSAGLNGYIEKHNLHEVAHPLVGAHVGYADKKLLILDVNGLLADIVPHSHPAYKHDIVVSKKYVYKRPFCDDFLQFCFEKFNVGVWSSRQKKNLDQILNCLMADSRHKLLFCWDQSHCTDTGFTTTKYSSKPLVLKELRKLWDKLEPGLPWNKGKYNESNTLLLDDSPYKALRNPANTAIFPHSYKFKDAGDSSLGPGGDLRVYLERLAEAENVQEYVACNPFGQEAITELNAPSRFFQHVLRTILRDESRVEIASSSKPSYTGNS